MKDILPVVFVTKNRQEVAFFAIQSFVAAANRANVKLRIHMYIGNDEDNKFFIWQWEMMSYWNKTYGHEFIPKRNEGDWTDGLAQGFADMIAEKAEHFLWVDDDMFLEVDSLQRALETISYKQVGSVSMLHPSGLDMKFTFHSILHTNWDWEEVYGNTKEGLDFQEFFIEEGEVVACEYAFPPMIIKTELIKDVDLEDFVKKCRGAILDNADQYITRHIKSKDMMVTLDTRATSIHLGETFGSFSGTRMLNKIRKVIKCYKTNKEDVYTTDPKEALVIDGKRQGFWFNDDRWYLFTKFEEHEKRI